jgi:phosphoglycerate dehydrogenase-like enzyme
MGRKAHSRCWLAPKLVWIHSRSAGLDSVTSPALAASSAVMTNGRGVFSRSLAEWVIGALLYFVKDFPRLERNRRHGIWEVFEPDDLAGRTLGIVGYGDIGHAIAERARRLGMRVLALRKRPALSGPDSWAEETLPPSELVTLMGRSDDVVVTLPLTEETRGFVGEAAIAALKPTGVLVNVGRGPVIDEPALVRALRDKRIRGAALDVFDKEPLPDGHPLTGSTNLLLSPHCADNTPGWLEAAMRAFVRNLERFRRGEPLGERRRQGARLLRPRRRRSALAQHRDVVARMAGHDVGQRAHWRSDSRSRSQVLGLGGGQPAQERQVRGANGRELGLSSAAGIWSAPAAATYWFSSKLGSGACSPRLKQNAR